MGRRRSRSARRHALGIDQGEPLESVVPPPTPADQILFRINLKRVPALDLSTDTRKDGLIAAQTCWWNPPMIPTEH